MEMMATGKRQVQFNKFENYFDITYHQTDIVDLGRPELVLTLHLIKGVQVFVMEMWIVFRIQVVTQVKSLVSHWLQCLWWIALPGKLS